MAQIAKPFEIEYATEIYNRAISNVTVSEIYQRFSDIWYKETKRVLRDKKLKRILNE